MKFALFYDQRYKTDKYVDEPTIHTHKKKHSEERTIRLKLIHICLGCYNNYYEGPKKKQDIANASRSTK